MLSRNHWTSAPVFAMEPSSPYTAPVESSLYASVVSKPLLETTGRGPVFSTRKLPVPNVHLASPGSKQVCPTRAACWSPSAEATGTPASGDPVSPYTPDEG